MSNVWIPDVILMDNWPRCETLRIKVDETAVVRLGLADVEIDTHSLQEQG